MESGPIRTKLIAVPVAALLVLGAVPTLFVIAPRHALAAGVMAWALAFAMALGAYASATKVFASVRIQRLGQLLIDLVGRHGDPADAATAELVRWLDVQAKRNLVLTFGGGVNEVQRELIAMAGLKLPRVPR